ncbi:MAG: hypothetical protein IJU39_06755, partial [Clostridia bacterium]|nr:hypothetical protein [Clostridia bacterium]
MDEFEKLDSVEELSENEVKEKTAGQDNTAKENPGFEKIEIDETFFLPDEPEKKSGFPILGIIAIVVAIAIAVGAFM